MNCINCNFKKLNKIVNIPPQPISAIFNVKKNIIMKNYPLDLYECPKCKLVQLLKLAPLEEMYGENYGYRTSLSPLMINHMIEKFNYIKKKCKLNKNSNILDIGCNDGTFLNIFAKNNYNNLYGIDPSAIKFKDYHHQKLNIVYDFFSSKKIIESFGKKQFDLITSFAMFYDISDPNIFCKDIVKLLKPEGLWILELSYWPLLIKNLTYDQICHEHIAYYSLNVFSKLVNKNGIKILEVRINEINGGSIEIICAKKSSVQIINKKILNKYFKEEEKINNKTFQNLNIRIQNTIKNLYNFLEILKKAKKKVYGYGASTKGNIILNHAKINSKLIQYIADANSYKIGRYTPGSDIKIISKEKFRKDRPEYTIVLIWSFRKEVILQEIKYLLNGGKLIFPLPVFHIVDKTNYKLYLKSDLSQFSIQL